MCGINGIISIDQDVEISQKIDCMATISKMNNKISHRGPDASGSFPGSSFVLGFRRLSIIDLDETANQPMLNEKKDVVIVFNGEIYNYLEIKTELIVRGHTFQTKSDTEVILKAYMEYGDHCVDHFNGMWAFAIYDFRKKRLFCSRDRLGVKPFYYTIQDGLLYFSSELKSLHSVFQFTNANHNKVYEYLAYGYRINDSETFFEDCKELLPGHVLTIENSKMQIDSFWKLEEDMYKHDGLKNYEQEFEELFESAVKLRYRSDVPVALLLSGGLDSSAIARVTDDLIENGNLDQNEIHAYIASFPNFKDDETAIAREFIKTCKHIKLHEMQIETKNLIKDFDQIIYDLDHPLFSFTSFAHNNIMKACNKKGIKVVLNGQGSDEAFAGYDRYITGAFLLDKLVEGKKSFWKEFKILNKKNGHSKPFLISQMIKSLLNPPFASYLRAKHTEKSLDSLNPEFVKNCKDHYKSQYKFSLKGNNFNRYLLNAINHQGLNTILHYEDVSSMQQSVEVRSPFMDYRLMEFAFSIPEEMKFKEGRTKRIIRDTIGKKLPDNITNNRIKIGFQTPFTDYITKDENLRKYIFEILSSSSFKSKTIWDAAKIKEKFKNPSKYPNFPFWRVINLEVWSKMYGVTNL